MLIAKVNLVLTGDRQRIVEEGDPEGRGDFPVAQAGEEIPEYVVSRFGLTEGDLAGPRSTKAAKAKAGHAAKDDFTDVDGSEE